MAGDEKTVSEQVRGACAWVAHRARSVAIAGARVEAYAAELPAPEAASGQAESPLIGRDRETRAAFVICLDAINFGSGWWPTIRKRPGLSGYSTIEAGLVERFEAARPWSAAELTAIDAGQLATVLAQDAEHPLMSLYAAALRDVGERVCADHGGSFESLVEAAGGSAVVLADLLAGWDAFADVSTYGGEPVPFYKRAQIAAADIDRMGVAELRDVEELTAFADNLVPHVMRVDGLLCLDRELERRIDAEELLVHGSPEEVELRACAVHAIELLSDALDRRLSPAQIDAVLWNRGRGARYKSRPRPRSRNTAY